MYAADVSEITRATTYECGDFLIRQKYHDSSYIHVVPNSRQRLSHRHWKNDAIYRQVSINITGLEVQKFLSYKHDLLRVSSAPS